MNYRSTLILMLAASCGTEDPPGSKGESLFPVAVGNSWTYRITDGDAEEAPKTQTITGTAADGAFVFETVRGVNGDRESVSIQKIDEENRLVRLSEYSLFQGNETERITYVPFDIRIDTDDYSRGLEYSQTYLEDHIGSDTAPDVMKTQNFLVEAVDELLTVPAGTYRTVRIRRTTIDGPGKLFWYAAGIGKIRETNGVRTEELTTAELEGMP